jgi:hypothetical protein
MFHKSLQHYGHEKHKRTWDSVCLWLWTTQRETKNTVNRIKSYGDERKECEVRWLEWLMFKYKNWEKMEVTKLEEQEESLSNCWSFIVLSCNGMVKLSQSERKAFWGYQFRPDSIICHFAFMVGMSVIVRIFVTLFQFSLSPINGTVIMHWVFSEWSFLISRNNFWSYTFLLCVLVSVILSSLLCCSTVMNITVVFSKTWVVRVLNNSLIVMIVRVFPMHWLCTTHKYAWSGYPLSDKFILLTTVGFLYVLSMVLVLFSPETYTLCVLFSK